ncbi:MAG: sugar phosphate isomerase/epimerase [Anaerolineales bacterium]
MPKPIALQLYSVREDLAKDFRGTLEKIAAIGFTGVETAGFPEGIFPQKAKQIFDELGLTVVSAHSPLPLNDQQDQVLETMHTLACPHLVSPWMNPDLYKSPKTIQEVAETFNRVYAICAANGLKFSIHNHDFEFQVGDGIPAIHILSKYLDPGITFELDTYWIHVAGQDPARVVSEFGARAPLLHIKDGPGVRGEPMLALGEGVVNIPAIVKAGGDHTEWLIVELDSCATDMLEAVEKSYRYLSQVDR